ncbi:hypothetical protein GCM10022399_33350 [Terrabacter ginsenosidimutans]|uniref:Uncharacterized protein n=1 Tax=Terrabacter ginsenosidimutans TaxID=490575 RepID=A0ABP7E4J0_9MICO
MLTQVQGGEDEGKDARQPRADDLSQPVQHGHPHVHQGNEQRDDDRPAKWEQHDGLDDDHHEQQRAAHPRAGQVEDDEPERQGNGQVADAGHASTPERPSVAGHRPDHEDQAQGTRRQDRAAGSGLEQHHQQRCCCQRGQRPVHRPNVAPAPDRVNRPPSAHRVGRQPEVARLSG